VGRANFGFSQPPHQSSFGFFGSGICFVMASRVITLESRWNHGRDGLLGLGARCVLLPEQPAAGEQKSENNKTPAPQEKPAAKE
jgi:hypothetical protein